MHQSSQPGHQQERRRGGRRLRALIAVLIAMIGMLAALDYRLPWLWHWGWRAVSTPPLSATGSPIHVIVTIIDHHDPDPNAAAEWATEMTTGYRSLAQRHRDSVGRPPQTSWFWSYDPNRPDRSAEVLEPLLELMFTGLGEVELRIQHADESGEALQARIRGALLLAGRRGALLTASRTPQSAFGFVHGKWALDNSRPGFCGVNDELSRLLAAGCYADFTMPSGGQMHSRLVNTPYYAADDPNRAKSYSRGTVASTTSSAPHNGLLLVPGPSVPNFLDWPPAYDRAAMSWRDPATPQRIDSWVNAAVSVDGQPNWVFVRPYMHGGRAGNASAAFGRARSNFHSHLETTYNDGDRFVLHYVTARETANLIRAAADGATGSPQAHLDSGVERYAASLISLDVPYELIEWSADRVRLVVQDGATRARLRLREHWIDRVQGADADITEDRRQVQLTGIGAEALTIELRPDGD